MADWKIIYIAVVFILIVVMLVVIVALLAALFCCRRRVPTETRQSVLLNDSFKDVSYVSLMPDDEAPILPEVCSARLTRSRFCNSPFPLLNTQIPSIRFSTRSASPPAT